MTFMVWEGQKWSEIVSQRSEIGVRGSETVSQRVCNNTPYIEILCLRGLERVGGGPRGLRVKIWHYIVIFMCYIALYYSIIVSRGSKWVKIGPGGSQIVSQIVCNNTLYIWLYNDIILNYKLKNKLIKNILWYNYVSKYMYRYA